ncbi:bifunctional DNA primase/polymerase [Bifidobacterium sp. ESL0784]|uniref:bifunctional DNA primase/polymerase n=1 Tax=Bifidobacterium sp. ESL0784 TaxID=2983231 RepID=UPI0023F69FB6|nr:bifunctional DNA primase/polymerase [Bifidobacterium sp. ESL0784]MDF7641742.1 bifunctional DNA primase/polymerase [Bifidobacterium sp. ESL0784]
MDAFYHHSCSKIPNGPQHVPDLLLGMKVSRFENTSNTFIDRTGQTVEIPRNTWGKNPTPYADDGYAKALWDYRNDSLLLGDDNHTLYVRDVDQTGNNQLLDTWHAITNLEAEYHVKSNKAYLPWNQQLVVECRKLDKRVRHGIKFQDTAFKRETNGIVRYHSGDQMFDEPYELTIDQPFNARLATQAVAFMRDITEDEHSAMNLARMFATPLLEPYKHLTYVLYGDGGNGKGILLGTLANSFPGLAVAVDSQKILGGRRGSGGFDTQQETGKLIGALWAYDEDADTIGIDQLTYLKKISTGDSVTARRIGENAVSFTPKCTFIVATNNSVITTMNAAVARRFAYIRMKDGRKPQEFQPLLDFRKQYGAAPFIMASCKLWENHGENPFDDVSVGSANDVTDLEQSIINTICANGYAPSSMLEGTKRYEQRDLLARFGLTRGGVKWVPEQGTSIRILIVKDEVRFAPYRKAYEHDREQLAKQIDDTPDLPQPIEADPLPLPNTMGFNCDFVPAEQKVAKNWKRLTEDQNLDTSIRPTTESYAVVPNKGMAIIDMDKSKDGKTSDGWTVLNQEIGKYGSQDFPSTYLVGTPSGGVHAYYALPAELMGTLKNSVHSNGIPVDIRCERKGYVIGPGSHTTNGDYWLLDMPNNQVPVMPKKMAQWLEDNGYVEGCDAQPRTFATPKRADTSLSSLDELLTEPVGNSRNGRPDMTPIPKGQRNQTLHDWAYGRLLNHPENRQAIHSDFFQRGHASGLKDDELITTWNSIERQLGGN